MTTLTGHAVIQNGRLIVDLPTSLPSGEINVQVVIRPVAESAPPDLTDLIGQLEWKGDAVAEQRRLRDEWPE